MLMQQLCQPEAMRVPTKLSRAAASSTWKGWGSYSRAKATMSSLDTATGPRIRAVPGVRSSKAKRGIGASVRGGPGRAGSGAELSSRVVRQPDRLRQAILWRTAQNQLRRARNIREMPRRDEHGVLPRAGAKGDPDNLLAVH